MKVCKVCGANSNQTDFTEWSIWYHCEPMCSRCAKWAERIESRLNMLCVRKTHHNATTWEKVPDDVRMREI